MFYIHNEEVLNNCIQEIKEQMPVEVVVRKKKRSNPQNNMYWKYLEIIGNYTGDTKDYLHNKFRLEYLPTQVMCVNGKVYELPIETKNLNTKEFSEYLDKIMLVASMLGLSLPSRGYYGY